MGFIPVILFSSRDSAQLVHVYDLLYTAKQP